MQNFNQLLQRLSESGLDFVIVAGYAAISYGSSFLTRDVDICAILTEKNIAKLRQALGEWNPKHRMTSPSFPF